MPREPQVYCGRLFRIVKPKSLLYSPCPDIVRNPGLTMKRSNVVLHFSIALLYSALLPHSANAQTRANSMDALLLTAEGKVESLRLGGAAWKPAETNLVLHLRDQLRTLFKSRATVRLADQSVLRLNQLTTIEIEPPAGPAPRAVLDLKNGAAYFYNRERGGETQFRTPQASGAIRGTEFHLAVDETGKTVLTLLDGEVDLRNDLGEVQLTSGEQGIVEPGKRPRKTAVIDAINIIQWTLYYPGVLDLDELTFTDGESQALADSFSAYREGDLLRASEAYPTNRTPNSISERIYSAALALAVGQVEQATAALADLPNTPSDQKALRLANALRQLVAAVKFQTWPTNELPVLATEWLARSYYFQSRSELKPALEAARQSAAKSPTFGFGWERVAELEFSFGRVKEASIALDRSLKLSPRNAEGLALKGFLLAAQNRVSESQDYFRRATEIDGALGNAWLGRGLTDIRLGHPQEGRQELQTAAAMEPNRALLRSYLGKAYTHEGDFTRAEKELALAEKLDPNDPTAWLYSALLNQDRGRINEAIAELEKSKELNENRGVFRSKLLLDQDQAVRSANLAAIYRNAGMTDWSVREASHAVNSDYGNYSAHLFLAESYDSLRDPRQINLRYETPWLSELLVANLLAPVGAGSLSQNISQQEYSKLFARDGLGISSQTEYFSNGAWDERASQFGAIRNSAYSLDVNYRTDPGQRPNNDVDSLTWWTKFKQQITPQDSIFLQTVYYNFESGDGSQYYSQASADPDVRIKERQEPLLFAGYHHEWQPGVHTLFLAGRLNDTFTMKDPTAHLLFRHETDGTPTAIEEPFGFSLNYRSELEGFSSELQQIFQTERHTLSFGGRYQAAWIEAMSRLDRDVTGTITDQHIDAELDRASVYAYYQWQIFDPLRLTAGLSYDHVHFPRNIDTSPITNTQAERDQISPKVGLIYSPWKDAAFRAVYTRSLGGVFFDNSVRLEPTEVAGFNQSFRSLIPESVIGLVPGTRFETFGVGFEQRLPTRTYIDLEAELLRSDAQRTYGALVNSKGVPIPDSASSGRESLLFEEKSLALSVNQLLGKEWAFGARYRISEANLDRSQLDLPAGIPGAEGLTQDVTAALHQINLFALYNHRCGFFSQFQGDWYAQSNQDYAPDIPGDEFWQFHFFVGYRFPGRLAELRLGVLNLTDRDYKLNPLTLYQELPRERTFTARLNFYF